MDIRTDKQQNVIRSRYLVQDKVYSDVFYALFNGIDSQFQHQVFILQVHKELVSPDFVDFCIERLTEYLYLNVSGLFELSDYEFDGENFYLIYKSSESDLMTLDLYLSKIKGSENYSKQVYSVLHQVAATLYSLETQRLVFGNLTHNNIFVSTSGTVILGAAKLSIICLEYYISKIDVYDDCIFLAPEVIKYFKLTIQTDIYAFGMLSYYIYTNSWPYHHHRQSLMKLKLLFQDGPQEPRVINSKISDKLNYFILKSIQLNPEERWSSFRAVLNILDGKDVVQFDRLSNRFVNDNMFESDIFQYKKYKIGKLLNRFFIFAILILLAVLSYVIYSSYFLKYDVVQIPYVESVELNEAISSLTELKLQPVVAQYNYHPTIPEDYIVRIEPSSGRSIKQGRKVKLFVSKGKQEILVPSFIGKSMREIQLILNNSNIAVEESDAKYSFTYDEGLVISQVPKPNQYIFENGVIQLVMSKGMPVRFDSIEVVDDDYLRVSLSLDLVEKEGVQHIEIIEMLESQKNTLYSDYHYFGDTIVKDFIINKQSELYFLKDSNLLFKKSFLDDDGE